MQSGKTSRREFLTYSSLAALSWSGRGLFAAATPAVLQAPCGTLRGESSDGVRIFRGVPFAEPPVGALRFKPTMKARPWKGERDATRFAAAAMQPKRPRLQQSEDCLYLNVWAPEGKGPFPVYVWIHGGGFTAGTSFDTVQDGAKFAREGIVCVTVAYRLGVFGFLDMEPLLGAEYAGSGNNAVRDLIAALSWVKDNIEAFGGDPARVTVGGESAGAKLTDILMGVPSAQPLFHQMISESGGAERIWPQPDAATVAKGFGELWQTQTGNNAASMLAVPAAELIATQKKFMKEWPRHFPLRTEMDSTLIPQLPVKTIGEGSTRGKRLLIGTNRDESAFFLGPHPAKEVAPANLGNLPLARFNEVFEQYKKIYPQMSVEQLRIRAVTAEEYWIPSMRVVDAHVHGGGKAWMYRMDFSETNGRFKGESYHSLDVWLAWDKPHPEAENAAAEAAMATQMFTAWCAFIRGETPAADGLPAWPEYRSDTRPTMILDTQSRVEQQPQEADLRLWDGVL
ncbi:carboxylesterase/lipase family protein [Acidobacterium sp. S8]|uniref:carboxylesterase/lipase family protein n=1 Tax=Acidobacterium sp. S8 TaxID=1641854 RepID=UPI00131D10F5|nr:carboxylesterase family protein [Acidobacterium sp. S8]